MMERWLARNEIKVKWMIAIFFKTGKNKINKGYKIMLDRKSL